MPEITSKPAGGGNHPLYKDGEYAVFQREGGDPKYPRFRVFTGEKNPDGSAAVCTVFRNVQVRIKGEVVTVRLSAEDAVALLRKRDVPVKISDTESRIIHSAGITSDVKKTPEKTYYNHTLNAIVARQNVGKDNQPYGWTIALKGNDGEYKSVQVFSHFGEHQISSATAAYELVSSGKLKLASGVTLEFRGLNESQYETANGIKGVALRAKAGVVGEAFTYGDPGNKEAFEKKAAAKRPLHESNGEGSNESVSAPRHTPRQIPTQGIPGPRQ